MISQHPLAVLLLSTAVCNAHADEVLLSSYAAHLAAAEATFRLGEVKETRRWLDAAPPQHRGFEWNCLDARLDESLRAFRASDVALWGLDVSPDGNYLAVGDAVGRVKVIALATGAEVLSAHVHEDLVDDVRFDATGSRLVSASHDRTVRIWDLATGENRVTFAEHRFAVGGAAFTPNGDSVISAGYERNWKGKSVAGVVHRWNAIDGTLEMTYDGGGAKPLSSLAIAPDGTRLAVGSWDFCAFGWDVATGGEPSQYITPDEGLYNAVDCVAFSPDGTKVAYGGKDHTAHVHDAASTTLLLTLRDHGDNVTGLAFSPDGSRIATTCVDAVVRVFDVTTGALLQSMRGATPSATGLVFTPDGTRILVTTADGRVVEFDATRSNYGELRREFPTAAYCVRFAPDDSLLASCTHDGRVQLFATKDFERVADWQAHEPSKCAIVVDFTPDGKELLSCSYDGTIRRWDVETQTECGRIEFGSGVYYFALSRDGATLAAALMNKEVVVADRTSGVISQRFADATAIVYSLQFDRAGSLLLAGANDRRTRLYDLRENRLVFTTEPSPSAILSVAFSPDAAHFVTGGGDGAIREWDLGTGAETRTIFSGGHPVNRVAFSRDGSRLVGVGAHVWFFESRTGTQVATLRAPRDSAWDLAFSHDGTSLAVANLDDSFTVLSATPLRER